MFLPVRRSPHSKNYTKKTVFLLFTEKSGQCKTPCQLRLLNSRHLPSNRQGAIGWGYLGEEPYRFSPLWLSSRVKTSTVNDTPRCARYINSTGTNTGKEKSYMALRISMLLMYIEDSPIPVKLKATERANEETPLKTTSQKTHQPLRPTSCSRRVSTDKQGNIKMSPTPTMRIIIKMATTYPTSSKPCDAPSNASSINNENARGNRMTKMVNRQNHQYSLILFPTLLDGALERHGATCILGRQTVKLMIYRVLNVGHIIYLDCLHRFLNFFPIMAHLNLLGAVVVCCKVKDWKTLAQKNFDRNCQLQ